MRSHTYYFCQPTCVCRSPSSHHSTCSQQRKPESPMEQLCYLLPRRQLLLLLQQKTNKSLAQKRQRIEEKQQQLQLWKSLIVSLMSANGEENGEAAQGGPKGRFISILRIDITSAPPKVCVVGK